MKTTLAKEDLAALIIHVSDEMMASKDKLAELDAIIGDGDLGVTVTLGFTAVKKSIQAGGYTDMQTLLSGCGMAFADNAASTFGALMSTMFTRAGRTIKGKDQIGPVEVAAMLQAAVEGVEQRGKAHLGDKTMLDALIPAREALNKAAADGKKLPECMDAALEAARNGAEETKKLRSKAGRSEWMGDRTIGVKDAGAAAMVFLLEAVASYVKK
jgi:phosphoenolpyruvate---glycerone phosphotransferase subunit DhaL